MTYDAIYLPADSNPLPNLENVSLREAGEYVISYLCDRCYTLFVEGDDTHDPGMWWATSCGAEWCVRPSRGYRATRKRKDAPYHAPLWRKEDADGKPTDRAEAGLNGAGG